MYRSAQRVGVAHQAHKTNGKIIGMGGRPQRRAVAGDDNGFARPDAGQRLPAAACAVQRHHGLAAAIGVAGAHDSHRKAFLPVPLHQEIFAGDLIAGILPVRVCQGGAFGDGQRGHGLLVCRRAADKNVLGRAPRKQAHVTLDVLLGKGDEIHRHVEPLVSQCGLHRSFVMDVCCKHPRAPGRAGRVGAAVEQRQFPAAGQRQSADGCADDPRAADEQCFHGSSPFFVMLSPCLPRSPAL